MFKKIVFIPIFLIALCCLSIYDMTSGFKLRIDVSDINNNIISVDTAKKKELYIEFVWNTGDTGSSIIIDKPGLYIVSAKDYWLINKGPNSYYFGPSFIRSYPDGVRVDTFSTNVPISKSVNARTYFLTDSGRVYSRVFIDSSWTDGEKYYWTETHPTFLGFWSGKLDTIIVEEQRLPIRLNTKVLVSEGNSITGKRWRVIY